jgi:hypothetical protein
MIMTRMILIALSGSLTLLYDYAKVTKLQFTNFIGESPVPIFCVNK